MQLCKIILIGLLSVILFAKCTRFSNKKNIAIVPYSISKVGNCHYPRMIWNNVVGKGFGDNYSNLHPSHNNNSVFVADYYGIVKSLDITNGKENWATDLSLKNTKLKSFNIPARLFGGITLSGSKIYIGSELSKVYAINSKSGKIIWKSSVDGEALSTPVVSKGIVLVHTSNGMLQALDEINGSLKWTINLDSTFLTLRGESTPAVFFEYAIVGGDNGWVSTVTLNQGQIIWRQCISPLNGKNAVDRINDIQSQPIVVNGIVYAVAYNGNLTALDISSGQIIWSQKIGSINDIVVHNGVIYLVDQNNCIIALTTKNGDIIWRQTKLLNRSLTSPVYYNDYIIVGDSEGYLYWINSNNGCFMIHQKINISGILTTPIVAGDKLIVQTKNGNIYAFINKKIK